MFAILGSGFGLYGYLPALLNLGEKSVLLPERYKKKLNSRPELAHIKQNISWALDDDDALDQATGVVIARHPSSQPKTIEACLKRENIKQLILEKPLAANPETAQTILNTLNASGRLYRISYIFRHLNLASTLQGLIKAIPPNETIHIIWNFHAHHYSHDLDTWKRSHAEGGGILRFYGIHLVALLAELGYKTVSHSKLYGSTADDLDRWHVLLTNDHLPAVAIKMNSRANEDLFQINSSHIGCGDDQISCQQPSPFSVLTTDHNLDRRVNILELLLKSFGDRKTNFNSIYLNSLEFWALIEQKSQVSTPE